MILYQILQLFKRRLQSDEVVGGGSQLYSPEQFSLIATLPQRHMSEIINKTDNVCMHICMCVCMYVCVK